MNEKLRTQIEKSLHSPGEGKTLDLSQEILSISDYKWLGEIITKSSVLETILLPAIPKEKANEIISILNKATINNSTLMGMDIMTDHDMETCPETILLMCQQIQLRLQRNKKKIFAIHGGGNIGLGLMAHIVSQSQFTYNIVATSNNSLACHLINSVNKLWLQHDYSNPNDTTCVNNVMMISRDTQDVVRLYQEATLASLCVTPAVLPSISRDIAEGLIARFKQDGSGLKILVLMNLPNCAVFVRDKIYSEILLIVGDEATAKEIILAVEFIPTVIDRIVTPIPEKTIKLQLKEQLENIDKKQLLIELDEDNTDCILSSPDKLGKAIIAFNLKFNLFNAEKNFSMYVHESFVEAHKFPLIMMANDLTVIEAVKNKYINGPHAILAWAGALLGFATIAESIKHPALFTFIKEMMEQEIGPILCAEYPELSDKDLEIFEQTFFERCRASVDDPNSRVGRDPMRKLNSGERVRGPLELAQKHNLKISTTRLEQGVAAGLLYAVKFDPSNPGCKKIKEIYEENNHSFRAILCYSGQAPSGTFIGLIPNKDEMLIDRVLHHIHSFNHFHKKRAIVKPQSSTALIISKQSMKTTLVSIPKTLSVSYECLKKEKNLEKQSSQIIVSASNSHRSQDIGHTKHRYYIWSKMQKKPETTLDSKNHQRITNC